MKLKRLSSFAIILMLLSGLILNLALADTEVYEPDPDTPGDVVYSHTEHLFNALSIIAPLSHEIYDVKAGIIFRNLNVTENSVINNATLRLAFSSPFDAASTKNITIYGYREDLLTDGTFTSPAQLNGPYSFNLVNWNVSQVENYSYYDINVTQIVQEVINRPFYSEGENIGFIIISTAGEPDRYIYTNEWAGIGPQLNITWGEGQTDAQGNELIDQHEGYIIWKSTGRIIFLASGDTEKRIYSIDGNRTILTEYDLPFKLGHYDDEGFSEEHAQYINDNIYFVVNTNTDNITVCESSDYGANWTFYNTTTLMNAGEYIFTEYNPIDNCIEIVFNDDNNDFWHTSFFLTNTSFSARVYTNVDGGSQTYDLEMCLEINPNTGDLFFGQVGADNEGTAYDLHYSQRVASVWSAQREEDKGQDRSITILYKEESDTDYLVGQLGILDAYYTDTRTDYLSSTNWNFDTIEGLGSNFNNPRSDSMRDILTDALYFMFFENVGHLIEYSYASAAPYLETSLTHVTGSYYDVAGLLGNPVLFRHNNSVWCAAMETSSQNQLFVAPLTWFQGSKTAGQWASINVEYSNGTALDTSDYERSRFDIIEYGMEDDYFVTPPGGGAPLNLSCVDLAVLNNIGNETAIIEAVKDCIDLYNPNPPPDDPSPPGWPDDPDDPFSRPGWIKYNIIVGLTLIISPMIYMAIHKNFIDIFWAIIVMILGAALLIQITFI